MSMEFTKTRLGKPVAAATLAALILAGCSNKESAPTKEYTPRSEGAYSFVLGCVGETKLERVETPPSGIGLTAVFGCSSPEGFAWAETTDVPLNFAGAEPTVNPEALAEGAEIYVAVIEKPQQELPHITVDGQTARITFGTTVEKIYVDSAS